jgi:anthranilate/para-aminobenzoate synthase component I
MQIIEELEKTRRGPYCGAIGYFESTGRIELNIAIRTMIVQDVRVHVPVGGGIVADSDPQQEYDETIVKAQAALSVLGLDPEVASLP